MITETDAGHIIYDDLKPMGLEMRLKGHLVKGNLDGEQPMVGESVPDRGMIVILPKRMTFDKTYFNECFIEVNILMRDLEGETNPRLNEMLKQALDILTNYKVGKSEGEWYRYSVRSHGIEEEGKISCHYANISIDFETLKVK